jgi:hypothetical protein
VPPGASSGSTFIVVFNTGNRKGRHCGMIRPEHTGEMVAHHLQIAAVRQRLLQDAAQAFNREADGPQS